MIKDAVEALEFKKVLGLAARHAHSEPTKAAIAKIRPLSGAEDIKTRFGQIEEIRRLDREETPLPITGFQDITGVLESVRPMDAVLEGAELLMLVPVLGIAEDAFGLIGERDFLPLLDRLTERLRGAPPTEIRTSIERSIDEDGKILDEASVELKRLRESIRKLETKIRGSLEALVREPRLSPFIQDDFVTKRSGRWVIPVKMDAKGRVQGVVHDVSRTGDTAFIEPLETIGPANELENLSAEAKAEEIRILRALSAMVRTEANAIAHAFDTVVLLDMLQSVARFAGRFGMETPQISASDEILLRGARHPLLAEKFGTISSVVPLDIALKEEGTKVMVITGPNAGGKTIAIKTVGILTLMALSGMPVPADASSTFPLFRNILVDIGDDQSIEHSLSTFSAHISNISGILKSAGPGTLVLMDELGTGTDPAEGAALSCAVLGDLLKKSALVYATTHLIDIVAFVHRTKGMQNASMEFDPETLSPLYRLKPGEPGESHALEIAEKFGLPESTVRAAKEHMGGMKAELGELIADLKEQRARHEEAILEINKEKAALLEKENALEERIKEAERETREKLKEAYEEARQIVLETKRKAYSLLDEAKKTKAKAPLRKLEQEDALVKKKLMEFSSGPALPIEDISKGDTVFVYSIGYDAVVENVDRKTGRLRVKAGSMAVDVSAGDVGPKKGKVHSPGRAGVQVYREESSGAVSTINVIGQRVDDALSNLEPFLNRASLEGLNEVTVIHGIGEGVLMKAIREHLEGHPLVSGFRGGEQGEGGPGVTVVMLK